MSYSRFQHHRAMIFDETRNRCYNQAIERVVTPDSVVLDLGAGLGVLGMLAAKAGARKVYLVEPQPLVRVAREIARLNNLEDRVVILEGSIEEIELPEPVDVIVSVMTGNLLFSEDLLGSLYLARDRYLKPGGVMLPDSAELWGAAVSSVKMGKTFIERWKEPILGLDFSPALRFASNEILWPNRENTDLELLSEAVNLQQVDLRTSSITDCDVRRAIRFTTSGEAQGLLCWLRIRLGEQWLDAGIDSPQVHWSPALLPFQSTLAVEAGDRGTLALKRPQHGDWSWSLENSGEKRRQSTFLAQVDAIDRGAKVSPSFSAGLSEKGEITLYVLSKMAEQISNGVIAEGLCAAYPRHFATAEQALARVRELALSFGAPVR